MNEEQSLSIAGSVWYALQTFHARELQVRDYLLSHDIPSFVPMLYKEVDPDSGSKRRALVPAVHNLLFVRKDGRCKSLFRVLPDCPVPVRILHHLESMKYYEIPDSQMTEFRAVCDPEYRGTLYTDREFAEARPGQQVRVVHGTFKGLQGKLVRYKNRAYVVVVLATLGVFVHIPKWYCERIL